jgi:hypothetical protein
MLNDHTAPKKSLVQVLFPAKDKTVPYFNDTFDLKVGDFVYVEGEFAGQIGRVTQINYHFNKSFVGIYSKHLFRENFFSNHK